MDQVATPADQNINKRKWVPTTRDGKKALAFCLAAIVWGILMPLIPFPESLRGDTAGAISGGVVIGIEILLAILGLLFSIRAIFKAKDRSVLSIAVFIMFCIVVGFWLFFAIGNIFVTS